MASRTLAWLVLFTLIISVGFRLRGGGHSEDTRALVREQVTYQYLRNVIHENYVNKDKADTEQLFNRAMKGMANLDPHSYFMPPDEYEPFKASTSGHFVGIGISLSPDETQGMVVLTPFLKTPAYYAGILPGDKILKIDGLSTEHMKQDERVHLIKGLQGSTVKLTVLHEGQKEPIEVTVKRDVIELLSVQDAEMLGPPIVPVEPGKPEPKIGYIELVQFQEKTAAEVEAALKTLEGQGMQALILDLRQNPGGLLDQAEAVADFFLKDGVIVTVITRAAASDKSLEEVRRAKGTQTHPNYPIAVLVDGQSASASEVVSGALRDNGRAVLVGDKTYGKYSVQRTFDVPAGPDKDGKERIGALKLTIARYKTPTSPCIDGEGIVPEYLVHVNQEQQSALTQERYRRQLQANDPRLHPPSGDGSAKVPEQTSATTQKEDAQAKPFVDVQLKKAVEVLMARLANPDKEAGKQ